MATRRRPAGPAAPTAVILEPQRAAWMSRLTSFLSPLLEYLGELALSIILVIFMLLKREELRNRVIRLAGHGKIVAATKFVDEAGHRVSRFLLMQAIVNASFGVLFGLGLLAIGVKYALLWGFLGAMLRYLPYIGPYLAVTFPISLSRGDVPRLGLDPDGHRAVPDPGADHLQLHRAQALRPEHGRLRDRPAGLGGVLGVPLGADRAGPVQPADGLPGGAGPLHPAARVPLRAPGRRAGARRRHQLLPAAAGARPGRGGEPHHRADEGGGVARSGLRHDAPAGPGGHQAEPTRRRHHRGRRAVRAAGDPGDRRGHRRGPDRGGGRGRRRPGRGRRAARGLGSGRAADPDLRLPGPRRRGSRGPRRCSSGSSTRPGGTSS